MESKKRLWESLRADAKQADSALEQQLAALERASLIDESKIDVSSETASGPASASPGQATGFLSSSLDDGTSKRDAGPKPTLAEASRSFLYARNDVEAGLGRFDELVRAMSDASRDIDGEGSAAVRTQTERYQGIAVEKRRALQRISQDFQRRKERLELLPHVNKRIEEYQQSAGVRVLMDEQDSLRYTQNRVNRILEQGDSTFDRLRAQRERFNSMADRLVHIAERIPVIQNVLQRINVRHRREAVVLATVIAICLIFLVIFW